VRREVSVAREIAIQGPIPLGSFVKLSGAAATGGEAKRLIQGGAVRVNGEVELRRGHDVIPGDLVELGGEQYIAIRGDAP
jgi:ribosome-associated protein